MEVVDRVYVTLFFLCLAQDGYPMEGDIKASLLLLGSKPRSATNLLSYLGQVIYFFMPQFPNL